MLAPNMLEHLDHIGRSEAEPRLDRRRIAVERVHDRQAAIWASVNFDNFPAQGGPDIGMQVSAPIAETPTFIRQGPHASAYAEPC